MRTPGAPQHAEEGTSPLAGGGERVTEAAIHKAVVAYLHAQLPQALIHHSPNEGNRGGAKGFRDGARNKAMGMLTGFPDLFIYTRGVGHFMEVKGPKGTLSDRQKEVRSMLQGQGAPYAVVRSVDDARAALSEWGLV